MAKTVDEYLSLRDKKFKDLASMTRPPSKKDRSRWLAAKLCAKVDEITALQIDMASIQMKPAEK